MLGARGTRWLRGRRERGNRLQHRHRPWPGREQKPKLILHAWTIRSWRTARQTAGALPPHSSSPPRRSPRRQPASSSQALRTRSPHRQASPSRGRRKLEACPTSWSPGRPWPCTAEPREATPPSSWVFSSAASQGRPRFNYSKMSNIAILQHHLGPVRHQVGDLGASPSGEGDQQSRRAGGGDGVIVEEETHPPALATCLVLVLVGLTNLREAGYLMVSPTFTFLLPFRLSIMQWTIRNSLALDSNCDILDKYLVQKSNLDIFRQSFLCYFCNTNNAGPSVLM